MSKGINKWHGIGNLGQDPTVRYTPSGSAVTNISIGCSESYKDKDGNRQERTEWVRVVFFGRLAEIAGEFLRKGSQVYVEGKLRTNKWQDKNGEDRYTTEILANDLQMLGGKSQDGGFGGMPQSNAGQSSPPASFDDFDDSVPF